MKREAILLMERATNSLLNAIEHFNRPVDRGRVEAVLIFLDHSFEMLLKSAIIERGGRIREAKARQTLGFDKCVRIGLTEGTIKFLTKEQALTLQAVNGLRDAAQHHIVDVSEGQLYMLSQASVTLFRDLLRTVFRKSLHDYLPERVLPISTRPPSDLNALFDGEIEDIRRLLAPGRRKSVAVDAKLRGLAILEGAVSGQNHQPTPTDLKRLTKLVKEGGSWAELFPGVASLHITSDGSGQQLSLRIEKKEGVPITIVKEGEGSSGVVAIKRVAETDYYTLSLQALSGKCSLGRNKLLEVIRHLKLQEDPEYFKAIRVGKVVHKMYSPKALDRLKKELPKTDIDAVWRARKQ